MNRLTPVNLCFMTKLWLTVRERRECISLFDIRKNRDMESRNYETIGTYELHFPSKGIPIMMRHGVAYASVCIVSRWFPIFLLPLFPEFGPGVRNSYVVKFLDPDSCPRSVVFSIRLESHIQ